MAEVKYAIVNFQPTANQAAKGMGHSCQTFQAQARNVSATSTKRITHKNVTHHD